MAFTDLGKALSSVPFLRAACSSALSTADTPGSGLKLMRLINWEIRMAMLDMVQGCTLHLDGKAAELLDEISLLESASLSRLHVIVTDLAYGECASGMLQYTSGKVLLVSDTNKHDC